MAMAALLLLLVVVVVAAADTAWWAVSTTNASAPLTMPGHRGVFGGHVRVFAATGTTAAAAAAAAAAQLRLQSAAGARVWAAEGRTCAELAACAGAGAHGCVAAPTAAHQAVMLAVAGRSDGPPCARAIRLPEVSWTEKKKK